MVDFSGKLVLFVVGLALLLPLSISSFAEPVKSYPSGQLNFYSDWMSPKVAPMESKTLYVSEYAKRDIPPHSEQVHATTSIPVKQYPAGFYNFYSDWMSPKAAPMESKTLYVSEYAKRDIRPHSKQIHATTSIPVTQYPQGHYNFYSDWMSPRVEPMETRTLPLL
jgi:hypothetical protein